MEMADVAAVAVTRGPGLGPCLSVGLNGAKTLAAVTRTPLLGIHHMVRRWQHKCVWPEPRR